jgi:thiamine monophosphate synthase
LTDLPICVSAVEPEKFVSATRAGADLIEIGNFDSFYAQGRRFEAEEVLTLTHKTRSLLPNVPLSVTVPHILPLDQQVQLAEALVQAGADIIQTEGGTSSTPRSAGTLGLIEKAAPTLAAASEISRAVSVPVLCASGLSSVTVPLAIAAGASGVGVGSAINQLDNEVAMVAAVRSLVEALATVSRSSAMHSIR